MILAKMPPSWRARLSGSWFRTCLAPAAGNSVLVPPAVILEQSDDVAELELVPVRVPGFDYGQRRHPSTYQTIHFLLRGAASIQAKIIDDLPRLNGAMP